MAQSCLQSSRVDHNFFSKICDYFKPFSFGDHRVVLLLVIYSIRPKYRSQQQELSIRTPMATSKNRMRAFRARRALMENAEQRESRLAIDRQYRRQRLADFRHQKTNEDWQKYLLSRSQYEVNRLANTRAKENEKDRGKCLAVKCAKERDRRQKLRVCKTDTQRNMRLQHDRDRHR